MSIYLFLMLFTIETILLNFSIIFIGINYNILSLILYIFTNIFILIKLLKKNTNIIIKADNQAKKIINPRTNKPFKRFDDIKFYKDDDK